MVETDQRPEGAAPPETAQEAGDKPGADEKPQDRTTMLEQAVADRDREIAALRQAAVGKDNELTAARESAAGLEKKLGEANAEMSKAVASYKSLVIELDPGMLAELITGNTISEVNESLKTARSLIERVRGEIEAKASAARVPAGAPQRSLPDLSALSAREKIQIAVGGKK